MELYTSKHDYMMKINILTETELHFKTMIQLNEREEFLCSWFNRNGCQLHDEDVIVIEKELSKVRNEMRRRGRRF